MDLETTDALAFNMTGTGDGIGTFTFSTASVSDIGLTNEMGYLQQVQKRMAVDGQFEIEAGVRWTSFSSPFTEPEVEILEET